MQKSDENTMYIKKRNGDILKKSQLTKKTNKLFKKNSFAH